MLVFAYEDVGQGMSLTRYSKAWVTAVKPTMAVEMLAESRDEGGRVAAWGGGTMVDKESHPMNVYMTLEDGRVWRVVALGTTNQNLTIAEVAEARNRLLATLNP